MVPFSFAGETFVAGAEGALYWPAQEALLVADLHLEQASGSRATAISAAL